MNSKNLNYAFNVEYYENTTYDKNYSFDEKGENRQLTAIPVSPSLPCYRAEQRFELQTAYPGLLVGVGNIHGYGGKGDIALGFTFDYVTGAPYIPGSSVKGVLRSAFDKTDWIRSLIPDGVDIAALTEEIFGSPKTMGGDVFYDAFPTTSGRIIALEHLAPHGGEDDPFATPNVLTLVKVRPNVTFSFSFKLHDGLLSAEQKLALFKEILCTLGIGAKTNVGYGFLTEPTREFVDKDETPVTLRPEQKQNGDTKQCDKKPCNKCGKPIFRLKKNGDPNPGWKYDTCRDCAHKK